MGNPGHRRLAAMVLALLLPLAACSEGTSEPPDTEPGDVFGARGADLETGKRTLLLTPAGRLTVRFADPVDSLEDGQTTDLTAREAPEGGSFVPIVWSFDDDVYGEIAQVFGDRQPLEIELTTGGESYPLVAPNPGSGTRTEYVAVEGDGSGAVLEVTYDGVTQTLDAESSKLVKGKAAGLYDLPKTKIRLKDCPTRTWRTQPLTYPRYKCVFTTAVPTPYVVNHWAKKGHTWLSVRFVTNLALWATGRLQGAFATYEVRRSKDLSSIGDGKALGTLDDRSSKGGASGILVFDVKGKLPRTMDLRREYELKLARKVGDIDAPKKRTVRIGGPVELMY